MVDLLYAPKEIQNAWAWTELLIFTLKEDIESKIQPELGAKYCYDKLIEIETLIENGEKEKSIPLLKEVADMCKQCAFNGYIWYIANAVDFLGGIL